MSSFHSEHFSVYLLIRNLGLANSLWGLILPQIAFGLPQLCGQTDFVLLNPLCCYLPIVRLFHVLSLDGCEDKDQHTRFSVANGDRGRHCKEDASCQVRNHK